MIVINRTHVRHLLSTDGKLLCHQSLLNYEKDGVVPTGIKSGNTYIYSVEQVAKCLNTSKESIIETIKKFNANKK